MFLMPNKKEQALAAAECGVWKRRQAERLMEAAEQDFADARRLMNEYETEQEAKHAEELSQLCC